MAAEAWFGFVGVVLGSVTTSVLTVYKERITAKRDITVRDQQYERDRKTARDSFQRDSILALQSAVRDLINAADQELNRIYSEYERTNRWPARQWETPAAAGWEDAHLRLEEFAARVFDADLRSLAHKINDAAYHSIWAESPESCKKAYEPIHPLRLQFQQRVTDALPSLY
ncbi:hypothetical protein ACFQZZ_15310 [Nocardia sp. GCM10030253]|uniref:hypothetical protein n=1 Tax=Nocardia sp. GCM10030253 TaxID=3273404 RepID=UPI00363E1091